MSRFNRSPSVEYSSFLREVREYADADHEPGEGVCRAIADALEADLKKRFRAYWSVEEPADGPACIRRVITGDDECNCTSTRSWIDREHERIGARDKPPHKPPYSDHATLWLDDGDPVLYSIHIYGPEVEVVSKTAAPEGERRRNGWFDLISFAEHWGLEIGITPFSWYNAFSTINVVFYSPEWARQKGGSE
ncbi:hypothetical protein G6M89_20580 [Natronolimnobius sp. AArcel1]|uniref:hypothetical protein n=1 Tax=Natronolimnobius sp. AArcel1 TaxID=1679093 RepID=UPI0013EC82E3|nr:hypothetical protein [Natronolimnobius sp. AArcel1]NGM71362.1 hypothetical protein [Natronolimnobius sp. AArcel1]